MAEHSEERVKHMEENSKRRKRYAVALLQLLLSVVRRTGLLTEDCNFDFFDSC